MSVAIPWTRHVILVLLLGGLIVLPAAVCSAGSIVVVDEDFDGYTMFPNIKPVSSNDHVNLGVPLVVEGADSPLWLAARFEAGGNVAGAKSINNDVGVQREGAPGINDTPVGRVGDNAGLILRLDLTGLVDVTLDFDWRTYLSEVADGDKFVVAYYKGDGTAFQPEGLGTPNNTYDYFNDPQLGNGSETWYNDNWVELLRDGPDNNFTHETFALPGDDIVYLAFWNDDDDTEVDYAKIDNVLIMADPKPNENDIPEPGSLMLLILGVAACSMAARRS
jgi:hypothetical protein